MCPVSLKSAYQAVPLLAAALPLLLRTKLMMAILGIVVIGIGLIALVLLGGRAAKRRARHRLGPSKPLDDAWYKRPLESEASHGGASDRTGEAANDED